MTDNGSSLILKQHFDNINLDFAEVLIMDSQSARAIDVLTEPDPAIYSKNYISIKNYLLASAQYLVTPASYIKIKQTLANQIKTDGKVSGWDFSMFNTWIGGRFSGPTKRMI
ncbi:hypothetical protein [Mucilaginibacter paludis]|uniref:Uncharacterized protein n=1 Tax=Mucilaginibacter paludis DSM 18603 TaxID=714943 RepID=H1YBJ7_9SPHI|nr:hypothetical protein [Mucilaginibacter paludis]EHQ25068.1 hypothetical protein Mucpa_0887 [Mucilaginibacter paludis DSM 18603]